ncbi:MAG: HEAT repeat domain-containing protein [Candidatus Acidiferrales bacterium]
MRDERNEESKDQPCSQFELPLVLFAAGEELDVAEQAELADHLTHCTACTETLEKERSLLGLLAENRREPDAVLLQSCRAGLDDALDQEEEHGWLRRAIGALLPSGGLAPRPAWSAALLLILGFSVGVLGPRFMRRQSAPLASNPGSTATSSGTPSDFANSSLGTLDLHTADVAGINVLPSGGNEPPQVELQLKAQQPFTVQGTVNNNDVKRILLYVLRNNDRFDPDVRLDAVDLLRTRNDDPDVRSALCYAVHTDHNAAVRLKALEALNGAEPQDLVRQTLLDALVDDQNPGVRVEAINALREMAATGKVVSDAHMMAVLRDRMRKDPNTYIRLQSAAAIRDLGPRETF